MNIIAGETSDTLQFNSRTSAPNGWGGPSMERHGQVPVSMTDTPGLRTSAITPPSLVPLRGKETFGPCNVLLYLEKRRPVAPVSSDAVGSKPHGPCAPSHGPTDQVLNPSSPDSAVAPKYPRAVVPRRSCMLGKSAELLRGSQIIDTPPSDALGQRCEGEADSSLTRRPQTCV